MILIRFAVLVFLLSAPAAVLAQTAAAPLWGRLHVPGTPSALAWAAGLNPDASSLTPEWVVFEAIRSVHGEPNSPHLAAFESYVRLLSRYEADREAAGPSISLAMAGDRARRPRFEALLRTAGLGLVRPARNQPEQVGQRGDAAGVNARAQLLSAGVPLEDLEARLNAGEEIAIETLALPWFEAPLPMYEEWWDAVAGAVPDRFTTILSDRRASLLFYGAASLDAETRQYLAARPPLVQALLSAAPAFAAFGGHLRVRDGRVEVPGGEEAVPWWEALAGAPVTAPDQFITRVLSARSGRLAYFYALLDAIGAPRARFVTGLSTPPATRPGDVFAWFDREDAWFQPDRRPFTRPVHDPTLLVTALLVDAEGRPAGPAWRYLWDAVFADARIPADPARVLRPAEGSVDAPYWFRAVLGPGSLDPLVRTNTVLFAQRVFPHVSEDQAPDLLVALRGFGRFPMLMLTLERAGVRAPAVYRAVAAAADRFAGIADPVQAFRALSQFQGAIALVEYAARSRRLDGPQAGALIESLASVPLDRQGSFGGDIARWLDEVLQPALVDPPVSGPGAPLEQALLAALTGSPATSGTPVSPPRGREFEWQGWRYDVDPARARLERVVAVRQRQAGNTVDAILTLSRVTAALSVDVTLDALPAHAGILRQLQGDLREPRLPIAATGARRVEVAATLGAAADDLQRVTDPRRLGNVSRVAARLHALTEALTADLLRALTYALQIPDPQSSLLAGGDISHQHDLGVSARVAWEREGIAWGLPERQQGGPDSVRARGSLLGLDVAMADLALGQAFLERFEEPAGWTFEDLRLYVQPLALFNPFDERLAGAPAVAAALRTGRSRVSEIDDDAIDGALTAAGVSPLRRALAGWARAVRPETTERLLSASELLRLGGGAEAAAAASAWGASSLVLDGCLCLAIEPPLPWEFHAGRAGAWGFLGARAPDLLLRTTEALDRLGLPPAAAADVLVPAMQSMLRRSRLAHHDDWLSAVRDASLAPAEAASFVTAASTGRSIFASTPRP